MLLSVYTGKNTRGAKLSNLQEFFDKFISPFPYRNVVVGDFVQSLLGEWVYTWSEIGTMSAEGKSIENFKFNCLLTISE
jgi:hypothetical protein